MNVYVLPKIRFTRFERRMTAAAAVRRMLSKNQGYFSSFFIQTLIHRTASAKRKVFLHIYTLSLIT